MLFVFKPYFNKFSNTYMKPGGQGMTTASNSQIQNNKPLINVIFNISIY